MKLNLQVIRQIFLQGGVTERQAALLRFGMLVERHFRRQPFDQTPERHLSPEDLSVPITDESRVELRVFGCSLLGDTNISDDVGPPLAAIVSAIGTSDCWRAVCSYLAASWAKLSDEDRIYVLTGILPPYFPTEIEGGEMPTVQAALRRLESNVEIWKMETHSSELRRLLGQCGVLIQTHK